MKVLQVNILGSTLSTGRTTREMHDYFRSHDIESYIACPTNKDCDDAFAFSSANQIKLDYVCTKYTGKEAFFSIGPTKKLIKYIKKINPDIVHLRVLHGNCIHLKMFLKYLAKQDIATVVTMHDFWLMTGICFHYTSLDCNKWKTGCEKCPALKHDVREKKFDRTRMIWNTKRKCFSSIPRLAVIGVSDWATEEIKKSFLKDAAIIKRIYNWVDLDVFYPHDTKELKRNLELDKKIIILAVSATWIKGGNKGLDFYLKLADVLPETYHIVLIGEMSDNVMLPENVMSISRTDSKEELAKYYSMADVYLNLSIEETFGKVSAEAVACGTPLVAYDSTANKELVPVGAGEVIKTLDVNEVLNAIIRVTQKDKSNYINICRNFADINFKKEDNIKEYINVYSKLIEMRG